MSFEHRPPLLLRPILRDDVKTAAQRRLNWHDQDVVALAERKDPHHCSDIALDQRAFDLAAQAGFEGEHALRQAAAPHRDRRIADVGGFG